MSVVTTRPERSPIAYEAIPHQSHVVGSDYKKPYAVSIETASSRSASVSSYSSNYSTFTAPTIYSPTSPKFSYRFFNNPSPPLKPTEPEPEPEPEPAIKRLPSKVYECILTQLQSLHEGAYQSGCVTCFQRDLHSLALTSRAWEKAVRSKLYNRIHILGNDSPAQLKKYRIRRGSRLKLLRRTLRERKLLANLVLELRVPEMEMPPVIGGRPNPQWEEYRDLVASVVMVCPNLERLVGFDLSYHHEFDRLIYALSTRKKLKEHKWIIGETAETAADRPRTRSSPRTLEQNQVFEFLNYHAGWANLETLMLHSLNMNGVLEHGIFLRMFNRLPSLRHLCVSSFDSDAFTDRTLLFLPPLESLRLENLRGVTDTGLAQYVSRQEAQGLKSLTLIEQNIKSLLVISKILASLRHLERFRIVQPNTCPTLPPESMVFQPILASSSLRYLHWDVAGPDSANALSKLDSAPFVMPHKPSNTPNFHLAQSILNAGFPRLGQLRAPSDIDPPGVLQSVCRPIPNGQALIPTDRYSLPRSSHGSVSTRPLALPSGNNLTSARIRAQTFIDMAAKDTETGMKVVITDYSDSYVPDNALESSSDEESEMDVDVFGEPVPADVARESNPSRDSDGPVKMYEFRMPAIMGRVGTSTSSKDVSIPRFVLRPDLPGHDADGGLMGWKHLLASSQALSYAAGMGPGNFHRTGSSFSMEDQPLSPASISRFAGWSGFGGRSASTASPVTPTSPPTPMTFSSSPLPPWARDICNGSWNQAHKGGKEWWFHVERERQGSVEIIEPKQFF
ncbi:hypothetical protein VTN77DRAFT_182 [Rasamsonia byssochlamydoides]|uniref:uncharacterized protein n=1 Tax=Rasamsonia byssochlamydoides TaxID=89139 RepID=UPI003742942E